MKIKKGDNVIVLAGKDRGKKGKVVSALPKKNKVIVEGVNVSFRHQRARKSGEKGTKIQTAMPVHASNVKKID